MSRKSRGVDRLEGTDVFLACITFQGFVLNQYLLRSCCTNTRSNTIIYVN